MQNENLEICLSGNDLGQEKAPKKGNESKGGTYSPLTSG